MKTGGLEVTVRFTVTTWSRLPVEKPMLWLWPGPGPQPRRLQSADTELRGQPVSGGGLLAALSQTDHLSLLLTSSVERRVLAPTGVDSAPRACAFCSLALTLSVVKEDVFGTGGHPGRVSRTDMILALGDLTL